MILMPPAHCQLPILPKSAIRPTHLLRDHDDTRSLSRSTYSGYSKELDEASEEIVSLCNARLCNEILLIVELSRNVVDIACSLELSVSQALE